MAIDQVDALIRTVTSLMKDDEDYYHNESDLAHWGGIRFRERVVAVAALAAQWFAGDFAEIGCDSGKSTRLFLEIAQKHSRQVLAVDPWIPGISGCDGGTYDRFVENTRGYENLQITRLPSQDPAVIAALKATPLCFAFVDGLHIHEACYSDILAVGHAGIIAVDDIVWDGALLDAFTFAAAKIGRRIIRHPFCREGYIL